MHIQPLYDKIVVPTDEAQPPTGEEVRLGMDAEQVNAGEVLAVGVGYPLENGGLRQLITTKGDRVLFNKYVGTPVMVDGEELLILREDDVLALVNV